MLHFSRLQAVLSIHVSVSFSIPVRVLLLQGIQVGGCATARRARQLHASSNCLPAPCALPHPKGRLSYLYLAGNRREQIRRNTDPVEKQRRQSRIRANGRACCVALGIAAPRLLRHSLPLLTGPSAGKGCSLLDERVAESRPCSWRGPFLPQSGAMRQQP